MASSSENSMPMDPLTYYRSAPFSLIRDNQVLSKALQVSLSSDHPQTAVSPELISLKRPNSIIIGSKKKMRKYSKGDTTTFIITDPANFRDMVQKVTGGYRFSGDCRVAPPLKPEPLINHGFTFMQHGYCDLPTLDTSTFLLKNKLYDYQLEGDDDQISVSPPPPPPPLSCFPTLESCSWKDL